MQKTTGSKWIGWLCGWWIACSLSVWATGNPSVSIHQADTLRSLQQKQQTFLKQQDTLSFAYYALLSQMATHYAAHHDSVQLHQVSRQMYGLLLQLHNNQKREAAHMLDSIYELNEKNQLIEQQKETIRFTHERLWYVSIGLLLLLIFTSWLIVQQMKIRKKNRFLVQKTQESLAIRQQLLETQQQIQALQERLDDKQQEVAEAAEKQEADRQLFRQIVNYLLKEKRFLQGNLTLEDLMLRFLLSKSRLIRLFRQQGGGSLNDYLNQLRLDYAIYLMQEQPQYTIDAIAEEAGFQARRTFYRLFRERFDMTPSEYKQTLTDTSRPTDDASPMQLGSLLIGLLLTLGVVPLQGQAEKADWKTCYEQLTEFAEGQLEQRLAVVDSLEGAHAFPPYQLQMLRASVYLYNEGDLNDAVRYSQEAYEDPQCQQDSLLRLDLIDLLATCHLYLSHYEESMAYTTEGIQLARKMHDRRMEACLLYNMGQLQRQQGLHKSSYTYYNQSIALLEQLYQEQPTADLVDLLCYYYQLQSHNYEADHRKTDAVQLLDKIERLFAEAEQIPDVNRPLLDCRKAEIYSFYANLLINCQLPERAEQAYQHYLATDYSRTPIGEALRYNYLQGTGRYHEAIQQLKKREQQLLQEGNGNTYEHKNLLGILVSLYEKQRLYGLAAETYQTMCRITQQLAENDQKAASLEMVSLYEANEKEQTIHTQQAALRHIRERGYAIAIGLLLLLVFTLWLLWQRWRIERKNRVLVQQIDHAISEKLALSEARQTLVALQTTIRQAAAQQPVPPAPEGSKPEPEAPEESVVPDVSSEQLFQQIDSYIREQRLFLRPDFSMDDLMLHQLISKSRLIRLIRTFSGGSFNEYLNNIRLDYSLQLMRENPQFTIEAIAEESGFQSRRTFYRLFRNRYEMTPSEYKKTQQTTQ